MSATRDESTTTSALLKAKTEAIATRYDEVMGGRRSDDGSCSDAKRECTEDKSEEGEDA